MSSSSSPKNEVLMANINFIYNFIKNDNKNYIQKNDIINELKKKGFDINYDYRLCDTKNKLFNINESTQIKNDDLFNIIGDNICLIYKIFTDNLIIPHFDKFVDNITVIYNNVKINNEGNLANYIPFLAKQDEEYFGISICTIDGQICNIGDHKIKFCLQSSMKAINYALALENNTEEEIAKRVGIEPSGVEFNALTLNKNGKPHNSLINAGAISICSLIKPLSLPAERFDYIFNKWRDLSAQGDIGYSQCVYLSEKNSADRNHALCYFMNENKVFKNNTNIIDVLDFYFQCCSLLINTEDLSVVAATLANNGVNPISGKIIFSEKTVRNTLSIMLSCGMYDYSGEFAYKIGIPSKSGVGGSILTVVPGVMGCATFSPKLDDFGNSFRGLRFLELLSSNFNYHILDQKSINPSCLQKNISIENMINSAAIGDLNELRRLKLLNYDLTKTDYDLRSILHLSASNGHLHIIKYLIKENIFDNILIKDRWGNSFYDDAIRENHIEIIEFFKSVQNQNSLSKKFDIVIDVTQNDDEEISRRETNTDTDNNNMI